jgi:hypothetical protein
MQLSNDLYDELIESFVKVLSFVRFKLVANNSTFLSRSTNIKELSLGILAHRFEDLDSFDDRTLDSKNLHKEDANKSETIGNCVRQINIVERGDADRPRGPEASSTTTRTFIQIDTFRKVMRQLVGQSIAHILRYVRTPLNVIDATIY